MQDTNCKSVLLPDLLEVRHRLIQMFVVVLIVASATLQDATWFVLKNYKPRLKLKLVRDINVLITLSYVRTSRFIYLNVISFINENTKTKGKKIILAF